LCFFCLWYLPGTLWVSWKIIIIVIRISKKNWWRSLLFTLLPSVELLPFYMCFWWCRCMSCCPLAHLTFPWEKRFNLSFSFVCSQKTNSHNSPRSRDWLQIYQCGGLIAKASLSNGVQQRPTFYLWRQMLLLVT
jgi:hypothetical protein